MSSDNMESPAPDCFSKGPAVAAAKEDPYIKTIIDERYLVEQELSRGGVGVIYLARDLQLYLKPVVIKVLLGELDGIQQDQVFRDRFCHQILALSQIDHPGVVGSLNSGQMPDGRFYLAMEFIDGVTLRSVLTTEGMAFERVTYLIRQVGQALTAAHENGVHHRDLKPENIMLQTGADRKIQAKIIGFGIATILEPEAAIGPAARLIGTPAYMAPEQLIGRPSEASDIYSLGVIAHEMLTGRRPFEAESPAQLLKAQRAGLQIKPKEICQGLAGAAQDILLRALAFEPQDRYARADMFANDLAYALFPEKRNVTRPITMKVEEPVEEVKQPTSSYATVVMPIPDSDSGA